MIIDWNRIQSFADENDPEDKEWLMGMVETLISNTEERLVELDALLTSRDTEGLRSLLHQLKGVAANFGLVLMQENCVEAESKVKSLDIDAAVRIAGRLREIWKKTRTEIDRRYPK
jgi:HPt (histidine-containing phosphotransfer) domain-containing protein